MRGSQGLCCPTQSNRPVCNGNNGVTMATPPSCFNFGCGCKEARWIFQLIVNTWVSAFNSVQVLGLGSLAWLSCTWRQVGIDSYQM